jgi:hypothetical protein
MVDYLSMTRQQLLDLGFKVWNEETGLMLIPGKLFDDVIKSLPKGTKLTSIRCRERIVGEDFFDDDTRDGLTAWGWMPK